uniref:Uncharacterized protein n=1 Tax=Zea mays TaxID=4577 RepID=C4J019_MAIZE|nr:unknown [Zea mays]
MNRHRNSTGAAMNTHDEHQDIRNTHSGGERRRTEGRSPTRTGTQHSATTLLAADTDRHARAHLSIIHAWMTCLRGSPAAAASAGTCTSPGAGLLRPALDGLACLRGLVARVRRGLRHPAVRLLHVVRGALERLPRRVGEARERGQAPEPQRARREEPHDGRPDEQRGGDQHGAEDQEHRRGHGQPHHGGRQRQPRQHQQQPAQREQRRHRQRLRRRRPLVVEHALHLLTHRAPASSLLLLLPVGGVGAAVDAAAVTVRHCCRLVG